MAGNNIRIDHPDIDGNQKTYLTQTAASGATTLNITNSSGFNNNDFVLIGKLGEESTEIKKLTATPPSTTTLTITALSFAHSPDTPITFIEADQVRVYKATSKGGSYSLLATTNITPDEQATSYTDATGLSTDYYKTAYYNSYTTTQGSYSGEIAGSGYSNYSRRKIADRILAICRDEDGVSFPRDDINDWINEFHEIAQSVVKGVDEEFFLKDTGDLSSSLELNDLPVDCLTVKRVWVATTGGTMEPATRMRIQDDDPDRTYDSSNPLFYFLADKIGFKPALSNGKYRLIYDPTTSVLTDDSDELPTVFKSYTQGYVNYGLYRAGQSEGKISKDAPIPASVSVILQRISLDISQRNTDQAESLIDVQGTYAEILGEEF